MNKINKKYIAILFSAIIFSILFFGFSNADVGNFQTYQTSKPVENKTSAKQKTNNYDSKTTTAKKTTNNYNSKTTKSNSANSTNTSSSSSSSSDASLGSMLIAGILVVLGFLSIIGYFKSKSKNNSQSNDTSNEFDTVTNQPDISNDALFNKTEEIIPVITEFDPNFSGVKFISWTKEVFIAMQVAWMERDWKKIRPFESDRLFNQHQMQLQEYINNGTINVMERINVNQAYLSNYNRDNEYEYLTVYMAVRMVDYIKDEKTGNVIKGDPNMDLYMNYLLTFMRKTGTITDPAQEKNSVIACPHCGAPVQIDKDGKCQYCNFIVTTGELSWVLTDMTTADSKNI